MDEFTPFKRSRRSRPAESVTVAETVYTATMSTEAPPLPMERTSLWKRGVRALWSFVRAHLVTTIAFLILIAALGYYYYQYHHILAATAGPAQSQAEVQKAVSDIEQLMFISDDRGAQLATITDTTKLAGQKFFANAKDGDELVLFPNTQQAVLYRPSINKIIAVGPFTPQANASGSGSAGATSSGTSQ